MAATAGGLPRITCDFCAAVVLARAFWRRTNALFWRSQAPRCAGRPPFAYFGDKSSFAPSGGGPARKAKAAFAPGGEGKAPGQGRLDLGDRECRRPPGRAAPPSMATGAVDRPCAGGAPVQRPKGRCALVHDEPIRPFYEGPAMPLGVDNLAARLPHRSDERTRPSSRREKAQTWILFTFGSRADIN
jgi:hypothetical protein